MEGYKVPLCLIKKRRVNNYTITFNNSKTVEVTEVQKQWIEDKAKSDDPKFKMRGETYDATEIEKIEERELSLDEAFKEVGKPINNRRQIEKELSKKRAYLEGLKWGAEIAIQLFGHNGNALNQVKETGKQIEKLERQLSTS